MTLSPNLLAIRALAALLLAVIGLQAVPAHSVGIERHHGSAFDIFSIDVAPPAALRTASGGEVQRFEPPAPPPPNPAMRTASPSTRLTAAYARTGLPALTGPPSLSRELASLSLAPRAPPFA
ncbi:hypothetical protein [Pelagerythrobacter rhizovicinus]|uniref:Uncharacterized protein n=1 Tax=Pelagerythrobacter rhizovicinus TaxID=2268576 RepID=A0A4Q2KH43_9SPHN|nr:hypothetical protein [Pelagerythrobacter rhizovicinus]RXZ64425.1 hypothetical protein ETX26_11050 [Pelagerythrobacter rhizovicinus]